MKINALKININFFAKKVRSHIQICFNISVRNFLLAFLYEKFRRKSNEYIF